MLSNDYKTDADTHFPTEAMKRMITVDYSLK